MNINWYVESTCRFPKQSALLSVTARGLDGQLCTPPPWDERFCCFPGKWLSLPVWLNYRCFERLKQIIKIIRAIKTIKHKKSLVVLQLRREEVPQLLWVLGEKCSTAQRENPNKSHFLGELTSCSQPAFQISLYLSSFTGLLTEAHHLCVVFPTEKKQLLSQGLRRPVWCVTLTAEQAAYKTGREPSWLLVTLQLTSTNRLNLLFFFQPNSAFIFLVASTISVLPMTKTKEKNKVQRRKTQTKTKKTLCQKNIPYARSIS